MQNSAGSVGLGPCMYTGSAVFVVIYSCAHENRVTL
jgi:hypothetical protein